MIERLPIVVVVLAHNEERRIAGCLASLPCETEGIAVHVVVNGANDRTAQIARSFAGVTVHDYAQGGKSRSWNRFILDGDAPPADCYVFVDGDAEIETGSVHALANCLAANPDANAAAGFPRNGRKAAAYAEAIARDHGLFGDCYALSGAFVELLRERGIRLPDDLVGDDGLICAMAKTNGENEEAWQDARVLPCPAAGFHCEPTVLSAASLANQYNRMIAYSLRHFQNRIVSEIMHREGPSGLPRQLATVYPAWLSRLTARRDPQWWWFDRQALARMRRAAAYSAG